METRARLLKELDATIAQFIDVYKNLTEADRVIYENWTAKDILGHITFWHESFARNVSDLVNEIQPTPLKGTFAVLNQRCREEMQQCTLVAILERLATAHAVIQSNILIPRLGTIPYRKGSRDYTPEEHLEIVTEHIRQHLRDIHSQTE